MSEKDGGTAFPSEHETEHSRPGDRAWVISRGMSLRDYMAAQALASVLAKADDQQTLEFKAWALRCASVAYDIADAMLAERAKS